MTGVGSFNPVHGEAFQGVCAKAVQVHGSSRAGRQTYHAGRFGQRRITSFGGVVSADDRGTDPGVLLARDLRVLVYSPWVDPPEPRTGFWRPSTPSLAPVEGSRGTPEIDEPAVVTRAREALFRCSLGGVATLAGPLALHLVSAVSPPVAVAVAGAAVAGGYVWQVRGLVLRSRAVIAEWEVWRAMLGDRASAAQFGFHRRAESGKVLSYRLNQLAEQDPLRVEIPPAVEPARFDAWFDVYGWMMARSLFGKRGYVLDLEQAVGAANRDR